MRGPFLRVFPAQILVIVMATTLSRADPLDAYGAMSRNIAMGGTGVASAASFEACYYNPAGLALLTVPELGLGVQVYRPFLTATSFSADPDTGRRFVTENSRNAETGYLFEVGIASPIPLGKNLKHNLFMGVHVALPGATIYAIRDMSVSQPHFPMLEERNKRLSLNAAVAGRYKWFMLGVGFSTLPNVYGDVHVDFNDGKSNTVDLDAELRLSLNVGLMFEPIQGLTIGLNYKGESYTDVGVTAVINETSDVSSTGLQLLVAGADYFVPHRLALGIGYKTPKWAVTGDATWYMYSRFRVSAPDVLVSDASAGLDQEIEIPDAGFSDTFSVRLGGEYRPIDALAVRAGFNWVQSPVPAQTGDSNLLDGDRFGGSLGLGFDSAAVGGPNLTLDGHVAVFGLVSNKDEKTVVSADNPGYPYVEGSGWVISGGLSLKYRFK